MPCKIKDCGKPRHGKGFCDAHYRRWLKHGDPLGGKTAHGEPYRFLRETVLTYDGDDCLIWPYGRSGSGRGKIRFDGRDRSVSGIVCEAAHGPAPTPGHESAHSCGRGHLGCVTKRHLSWKTHAENMADMLVHGTSNRGEKNPFAKLTRAEVRQIRKLIGTADHKKIAGMFGISRRTIRDIANRRSWAWLSDDPQKAGHRP